MAVGGAHVAARQMLETQPNVFASCRQANLKGEDRFLFMPLMLARRASPSAGASAGAGDGAYEVALEENADGAWEVKPHIANTARRSPEAAQDIARRLFHVFAIFDGHNGWKCADFLRLNLMKALEAHCKGAPPTDREAVRKAVVYLHRKYCSLGWGGGSTLTLVVIQGWNVLVCNVGDSRGYLDTDIFAPTDAPSTTSSSVQRKEDSPHTTTSPPPSLDTSLHGATFSIPEDALADGGDGEGEGSGCGVKLTLEVLREHVRLSQTEYMSAQTSIDSQGLGVTTKRVWSTGSTITMTTDASEDFDTYCPDRPGTPPPSPRAIVDGGREYDGDNESTGKGNRDEDLDANSVDGGSASSIEDQIVLDKSSRGVRPNTAVTDTLASGHFSTLMLRSIAATKDKSNDARFLHCPAVGVVQVTEEHNFTVPEDAESTRVKAAGGLRVAQMQVGPSGGPKGPLRVWPGGMCCSRSIGDWDVWGHAEDKSFMPCEPNFFATALSPCTGGRLVVASDGLWDTMGGDDVVKLGRHLSADRCAKRLLRKSVKSTNGPRDDTTLVVIDLKPPALPHMADDSARSRSRGISVGARMSKVLLSLTDDSSTSGSMRGGRSANATLMEALDEVLAAEGDDTPQIVLSSKLNALTSYVHMPAVIFPSAVKAGVEIRAHQPSAEDRVHGGKRTQVSVAPDPAAPACRCSVM